MGAVMPKAARLGDSSSGHSCFPATPIVAGSPDVSINGKPAARKGDTVIPHGCPCPYTPHGFHGRSISAGSSNVSINGKPAARVGDAIDCGGSVAAGSGNVFIGDTPYQAETFDCGKDAVAEKQAFLKITPISDAVSAHWTSPVFYPEQMTKLVKNEAQAIDLPEPTIKQMLAHPELDGINPVNLDPASMLAEDVESFIEAGKDFIKEPSWQSAAVMAAIAIPGKFADEAVEKIVKTKFVGKYKGKDITLDDVEVKPVLYEKRDRETYRALRREFDNSVRKDFLKTLATDPTALKQLKKHGVKESEIAKLAKGKVPKGYQVHHKLPLDDGGTNDFDNLVLIRNSPEHSVFTTYQKQTTGSLEAGSGTELQWPVPNGTVFPKK